jgi:hypothetical protein
VPKDVAAPAGETGLVVRAVALRGHVDVHNIDRGADDLQASLVCEQSKAGVFVLGEDDLHGRENVET